VKLPWVRAKARFIEIVGIHESPERLAAAWALGVGIGLSPLMGLHTVLAIVLALLFRLNKVDVLLGTLVINPWTLTVYFPAALLLGKRITGVRIPRFVRHNPSEILRAAMWHDNAPWLRSVLLAWSVGATVIALLVGLGMYFLLKRLIQVHREHYLRRHPPSGSTGPPQPTPSP
jgi:uncharacterized protein (DUF2062 family)